MPSASTPGMITSPAWLPATLFAGALQAWRTAVQRRLGKALSVNAAGLVRYLYGLPFALALAARYQLFLAPGPMPATPFEPLLMMMVPMAPASWAFRPLTPNSQLPRRTRAILPVTAHCAV